MTNGIIIPKASHWRAFQVWHVKSSMVYS